MTLPSGWELAPLADVTSKVGSGATPRGGEAAYKATGTPLIRSMNVHFDGIRYAGLAYLDAEQARALDGVTVAADDVLLNITGASIGRVATASTDLAGARVNQHVSIIRLLDGVTPSFVWRWLASPGMQRVVADEESGATRQALTKDKILGLQLPVAPVKEQRRIVAKLDAIFDQTRAAKARLERLPALLEKLKRSILGAAFRGDLTKDWRAAHPDTEPASEPLNRIRGARRAQWDEGLRRKGKDPKSTTYVEPGPVDIGHLPELPEGWIWASLGEMCSKISDGEHISPKTAAVGVPLLSAKDIRVDAVNFETSSFVTQADAARFRARCDPKKGDVLVVSRGATIGRSTVVATHDEFCLMGSVIQLRCRPEILPEYLGAFLASSFARRRLENMSGASAQQAIYLRDIATCPVPLPPIHEQEFLASLICDAVRALTELRLRITSALVSCADAEQAALAKAFRGELVQQDPTDEPASVLLDRIRAARATETEKPRRGRGQRRDDAVAAKPDALRASDDGVANGHHDGSLDLIAATFQVDRRRTATAIAEATGLDAGAVKKALKTLVDAGMLRVDGTGRDRAYEWMA